MKSIDELTSLNDKFQALEREAIDKLAGDDMKSAAEVLPEFAYMFAISGYKISDFLEYREMLIQKAELKSKNPELLRMKLEIAEREQREKRGFERRAGIIH